MYLIFPPHLTIDSALRGETGNPKIASFHWNAACFFLLKTRNILKNITWSELNHSSLSKGSTGCTRQNLGREHSILLSVTHMLCMNQVCYGVSVKDGSCSSSSLEWKSTESINEISYYLNKRYTLSNTSQMTTFLSGRQRTGALCV